MTLASTTDAKALSRQFPKDFFWGASTAARGLAGWVRNMAGGAVEAVFHGPAVTVDDMIAACRLGPPAAAVTRVTVEPWAEAVGHDFHQRPTA